MLFKSRILFGKAKIAFVCILMLFSLSAFSATQIQPENLTKTTRCAACNMVVLNYPGTHAQVIWKQNGKLVHKFYGNLSEIMPTILANPDSVVAIYVQALNHEAFAKMHEAGDWMAAEKAIYVVDSKQGFVMGESYTPFKTPKEASDFQKANGGKIVSYSQLKTYVFAKIMSKKKLTQL